MGMIPICLLLMLGVVAPPVPPVEARAGQAPDAIETRLAERRRVRRVERLERELRQYVSRRIARIDSPSSSSMATWLRSRADDLQVDPAALLPSALRRMASDPSVDLWCRAAVLELGSPPPPDLDDLSGTLAELPRYPPNPAAGVLIDGSVEPRRASTAIDTGDWQRDFGDSSTRGRASSRLGRRSSELVGRLAEPCRTWIRPWPSRPSPSSTRSRSKRDSEADGR